MDSSVLTKENFLEYTGKTEGNHWDFERFNPAHFQHIEKCILALRDLGIEADLIVMHPYDRWGFSQMTKEQDDLYWKYVIARFCAYRNIWWALANEYDLFPKKTVEDWERYAKIICEKDPYQSSAFHPQLYPVLRSQQTVDHTLQYPETGSVQIFRVCQRVERTVQKTDRTG